MNQLDLRDALVAAGVIDGNKNIVADLVAGFDTLKAKETRTDEENELLRETSLLLNSVNYHGKREEALAVLLALQSKTRPQENINER